MVVSMDQWKNKVVVVTGASAGIGAAIAEKLAKEGLKVVGLARRKEKIEELAQKLPDPSQLIAVKADISKEVDILAAFKWIEDNVGPVHVLINNAGIIRVTSMIDGDTAKWREVMDTNVMGLSIATREAIKNMRANNVDGHVININSVGGHMVFPHPMNIYYASKFAVTALTETVRQELNAIGSKIKITSISPGAVATEIAQAAGYPMPGEPEKDFPVLKSEDIADAVIYVLSTPPGVQVHELIIKPTGEKL